MSERSPSRLPPRPWEDWVRESMREDAPRPGAKNAALAALGFGSAAAVAGSTAAAAVGSTAVAGSKIAAAGLTSSAAVKGAGLVWVKWLIGGALAGTVSVAALDRVTSHEPRQADDASVSDRTTEVSSPKAPSGAKGGRRPPAIEGIAVPGIAATSGEVRRAPVKSSDPAHVESDLQPGQQDMDPEAIGAQAPVAPSTLRDELRFVQEARRTLLEGNAGAALAAIDAYDRAYPAGAMQQEARALEVQAYYKQGDRTRAALLARRYLANHPVSAHTPRIAEILEAAANE
jgi:hypothetical protein